MFSVGHYSRLFKDTVKWVERHMSNTGKKGDKQQETKEARTTQKLHYAGHLRVCPETKINAKA